MLKPALEALVENLRLLKDEGVSSIYVSEETLEVLKNKCLKAAQKTDPGVIVGRSQNPIVEKTNEVESVLTENKVLNADASVVKKDVAKLPDVITGKTKLEQLQKLKSILLSDEYFKEKSSEDSLVYGEGDVDADILFCGDIPTKDEELEGKPLVGDAGILFNKILIAAGLKRDSVYVVDALPYCSSGAINRRQISAEALCYFKPYLDAQIKIVSPKIIVALGLTASTLFLGGSKSSKLNDLRGHIFEYNGIPLIVSYHPEYLIKNGSNAAKRTLWEDFLLLLEKQKLPVSEKQRGYFLK